MRKIRMQDLEKIPKKILPNSDMDNPLTAREMKCLTLLAGGKNPDQCADLMKVTYTTIVNYERIIRLKLGAHNRAQALYMAIQCGYLKVED